LQKNEVVKPETALMLSAKVQRTENVSVIG
jgi:hypothetical protein